MALFLPPAVSINKFVGGYKSVSDYTDLTDTETNDAANVFYGPNGDIDKRNGSLRINNRRIITSLSNTSNYEPITGHYYFNKVGTSSSYHIVAAADALWNFNSNTAVFIRSSLNNNSEAYWNFVQLQDPRAVADDIAVGTNYIDPIQVWNGTGTAVLLSSFTSASQVPRCRYLLHHKERLYAANINDSADVDAAVRVFRTAFGTDGLADPHRFTENFYVGGSDKDGQINGLKLLNDQVIIYKRKSIWKFNPGSGDNNDLSKLQESIGLFAPFSLVDAGNFHIFLSERGVYAFDGTNFVHLSEKVDDFLFQDSNPLYLENAKAVLNKELNQYILYFAGQSSARNNRALIYDLRDSMKCWQPPITGREVNYISTFDDNNGVEKVLYGDYFGYLYQDNIGNIDGINRAFNGTVSTATVSTLTEISANFTTAGDGLAGLFVLITSGTGEGQAIQISSNTTATLNLVRDWGTTPDTTSGYSVAPIDANWRSKDYDFGAHDLVKIFRHLRVRLREEGNINLLLNYMVDFTELPNSTLATLLMLEDGMAWDSSLWGAARWGGRATIRRKISLRNTDIQSTTGTHLALRFSNRRSGQPFRISGFDIELNQIGKR